MLRDMGAAHIVLAIVGIGFLIAWHELGHYVVARVLGVRVLKYSVGFGPKLVGFRHKDIDYQIAAFPIGGFVQMKGMTPLEDGAVGDPRSFIMRPRWVRWLVLAAGPGFNYGMAAALFFAYVWVWPSPVSTTAIELSAVPTARPCHAAGECPDNWQCLASPKVCAPPDYDPASGEAGRELPAAKAGLQAGDVITAVDGNTFDNVVEFKTAIASKNGAPVTLHLLRADAPLDVTLAPVKEGSGFVIGVSPAERRPRTSIASAAGEAVNACVNETTRTLEAFGALFRREPGVEVGSPVAIVADMKDKIAQGPRFFVMILAMLSVNLGLLNLLPVPSLDGIKMLFLTVEGTIRKDLHAGFQVWVNALGLLALLGLMVVLMARDTLKLIG